MPEKESVFGLCLYVLIINDIDTCACCSGVNQKCKQRIGRMKTG